MDDLYIYIIFCILDGPAAVLFGFVVARQLRARQNMPLISALFMRYRWLTSALMGILINGMLLLTIFLKAKPSVWNIPMILVLALIASTSYYFGITFGWGRSSPSNESPTTVNQTLHGLPDNIIVDDTPTSLQVTINTKKRWFLFVESLLYLAFVGFLCFPLCSLALLAILQNHLPKALSFLIWFAFNGLFLYRFYKRCQEDLEYIFDKEIIEIDAVSVKVGKYGLGLKSRKEYAADDIHKIAPFPSLFPDLTNVIPSSKSNTDAFMLWHTHKLSPSSFGRAVDPATAQSIMETIYSKFPQYKG